MDRFWGAGVALALGFALAGCGAASGAPAWNDGTKPSLTLESAKSKVLAARHEIIEMVPGDLAISVFENDTSSLMSCRGEQKKWAGTGQVQLRPGLDRDRFLDGVKASFSGRPGWAATDSVDNDGERRVDVGHEDGTHLLVSFWDGPESLQIGSFSACFNFPEYEYGEKY